MPNQIKKNATKHGTNKKIKQISMGDNQSGLCWDSEKCIVKAVYVFRLERCIGHLSPNGISRNTKTTCTISILIKTWADFENKML